MSSRELLKQVLEAVRKNLVSYSVKDEPALYDVFVKIEAELAKPELTGWYCPHCETGVDSSEVTNHEHHQVCGNFIGNTEPPKIKPDPVGFTHKNIAEIFDNAPDSYCAALVKTARGSSITLPLYTSPPQQKPLSDDEIISIGFKAGFAVDTIEDDETEEEHYGFIDEDGNVDNEPFIKFVRLVEKAHGIGEQ